MDKWGPTELVHVSDGHLFSPSDIVRNIDHGVATALAPLNADGRFTIPVNNVVIRDGSNLVLVDTGAGNTMPPTLGHLRKNLGATGIDCAAITHVVITHLHPDHANGLVDEEGRAAYPNATLVVPRAELDFWLGEPQGPEPESVARNRRRTPINLAPYGERIIAAREGDEVVGLTAMTAPGHTPGHTVWFGASGLDRFVIWGDLVHLAAVQVPHPEAAVSYDIDGAVASATRRRLFDMFAAERVTVIGAHLASTGPAYLVRRGAGYAVESG